MVMLRAVRAFERSGYVESREYALEESPPFFPFLNVPSSSSWLTGTGSISSGSETDHLGETSRTDSDVDARNMTYIRCGLLINVEIIIHIKRGQIDESDITASLPGSLLRMYLVLLQQQQVEQIFVQGSDAGIQGGMCRGQARQGKEFVHLSQSSMETTDAIRRGGKMQG